MGHFIWQEVMEHNHPDLYRMFAMGQWVVQESSGALFTAAAGDMKMEQTHQRTSKGPAGHYIVGCTRIVNLVTKFNILFHEIESIRNNLLNVLSKSEVMKHSEIYVHHTLHGSKGMRFHKCVTKLLDFVIGHGNPYETCISPLHNFITKQAVHARISERIVKALENGETHYQEFHTSRKIGRDKFY